MSITEENKENSLVALNDTQAVADLLDKPSTKFAELFTGIIASDKSQYALSAGRLAQAFVKNNFTNQFGRELRDYIEKGKIKEDYFASNNTQATLLELLQFIDEGASDLERFKAMKSIFFYSASVDVTEKEQLLAYELMQVCKQLSGTQILILKKLNDYSNSKEPQVVNTDRRLVIWMELITQDIGLNTSLTMNHITKLDTVQLINGYFVSRPNVEVHHSNLLSDLGKKVCEFITKYP